VVETEGFFQRMIVDSLTPEVDPQRQAQVRYKAEETAASRAARQSYLGRVYLDWAQYPVLEVQPLEFPNSGYLVRFQDLRFMYPERQGGALSAYALLTPDLRVADAWFGGLLGTRSGLASPGKGEN
jgi:inner membrane protein